MDTGRWKIWSSFLSASITTQRTEENLGQSRNCKFGTINGNSWLVRNKDRELRQNAHFLPTNLVRRIELKKVQVSKPKSKCQSIWSSKNEICPFAYSLAGQRVHECVCVCVRVWSLRPVLVPLLTRFESNRQVVRQTRPMQQVFVFMSPSKRSEWIGIWKSGW